MIRLVITYQLTRLKESWKTANDQIRCPQSLAHSGNVQIEVNSSSGDRGGLRQFIGAEP